MKKMMLGGRMDEVFKIISSNYKHLGEVIWISDSADKSIMAS
jgi:hypothetical protein